ncbi:MAG: MFS transporter [Lachnospiraceae bacterium]
MNQYTIKYAAVQAFYWAALCAVLGFAVIGMLEKGYSNSEIGYVMAFSNIVVVVLQPLIANAADKNKRLTLKLIIWFFSFLMTAASVVLLFLATASFLLTVMMAVCIISVLAMQPFINTMSVQLEERGIAVNFGVCRSCGSLSYAFISSIVGILIKTYSYSVVPVTTIFILIGLFFSVGILAGSGSSQALCLQNGGDFVKEQKSRQPQGLVQFLFTNKRFFFFLIGTMLIFYTHMITSNYLIQIVSAVGGDSSHTGIAASIAAVLELPAMIFFTKLVKRIRCQMLLRISGIFFMLKYLFLFLAKSVGMIYFAEVLQIGAYALFVPASVYYVSRLFGSADMVKGQSMVTTAMTLGSVFASIIGGWMLDACGVHDMQLVAVLLALLGVIIMSFSMEKISAGVH